MKISKVLTGQDVFEAAEARCDFIVSEFERPCVSFSGGKDSTVILELMIRAARRAGTLPMDVLFVDQESEWNEVVEYMRRTQARPEVNLHWYQGQICTSNGMSEEHNWFRGWDPAEEHLWLRKKEPESLHDQIGESIYIEEKFTDLAAHFGFDVAIDGIRIRESLVRRHSRVLKPGYKWITWSNRDRRKTRKRVKKGAVDPYAHIHDLGKYELWRFSPVYDWDVRDVWRFIIQYDLDYCKIYNGMIMYGVPWHQCRVSSFTHAMAQYSLQYIQELEPDTWEKMQARLKGVNAAKHMGKYLVPLEVPVGFEDWKDYRDYLVDNLVENEETREVFRRMFKKGEKFEGTIHEETYMISCVGVVIRGDTLGKELDHYLASANMIHKGTSRKEEIIDFVRKKEKEYEQS